MSKANESVGPNVQLTERRCVQVHRDLNREVVTFLEGTQGIVRRLYRQSADCGRYFFESSAWKRLSMFARLSGFPALVKRIE